MLIKYDNRIPINHLEVIRQDANNILIRSLAWPAYHEDDKGYFVWRISFDDLKNRVDYDNLSYWALIFDKTMLGTIETGVTSDMEVRNMTYDTKDSKLSLKQYNDTYKTTSIGVMTLFPHSTSLDDCNFIFFVNEKTLVKGNVDLNFINDETFSTFDWKKTFPKISISGNQSVGNQLETYRVEITPPASLDLYVKSKGGNLPSTVFPVTSGVGEFSFDPSEMISGEITDIKVGTKFVSNINKITVTKK